MHIPIRHSAGVPVNICLNAIIVCSLHEPRGAEEVACIGLDLALKLRVKLQPDSFIDVCGCGAEGARLQDVLNAARARGRLKDFHSERLRGGSGMPGYALD